MAELKAGCQALIIGGYFRENDGKSVTVVEFIPSGANFYFEGQRYQEPEPKGDAWLIAGNLRVMMEGKEKILNFGLIHSKYLMPLDDDFTNELIKERELTHG